MPPGAARWWAPTRSGSSPPGRRRRERAREVLTLVAGGYTNRRIAGTPFISESTAGVHVSNVRGTLGVGTRTEAAAVAVRLGLDRAAAIRADAGRARARKPSAADTANPMETGAERLCASSSFLLRGRRDRLEPRPPVLTTHARIIG